MYQICKQFTFSASHILEGLPEEHPCSRLHGHNYVVELVLESAKLDATGFVVDYGDLTKFDDMLKSEFDHRHLNDVVDMQTSAENLARYFYGRASKIWPSVSAVRVSETVRTWAEYRA